jgi:alpha,alpha-trehalase
VSDCHRPLETHMLEDYIKDSWGRLLRNSLDVALDPKVSAGARAFLYISPFEDAEAINAMILSRRGNENSSGPIEIRVVPDDLNVTDDHGILYLPYDYIVPGGRFNEMYGWDSYWIVLGLLQQGFKDLAVGMVENCIYQIKHYGGKILNANRTYYLSRSQPPILTSMALAVLPVVDTNDRADFLRRSADAAALEYVGFWKADRFDPHCGLFHYGNIDQGELGLCPETTFGERDASGMSHYDKLAAYLRQLPETDSARQRFYDETSSSLSVEAIAGDRAMRESGFDASMHMGWFGMQTLDFRPACLNSLLYKQCQLLAHIYSELGQHSRARYFEREAAELRENIQTHLWNDDAKLFLNYNRRDQQPSHFPYLTCVYPLWAGIATEKQARHFRDNLPLFEAPFGIKGTHEQTGCQWDSPFMWAPLVYFTVAGLQRYGFIVDARRIAQKFVDTVRRVNEATNANFEKYNADTGGYRTEGLIDVGYSENVVGFGWTNGTVLIIEDWLRATESAANDVLFASTTDRIPEPISNSNPVEEQIYALAETT